jgi:hypothetical protein
MGLDPVKVDESAGRCGLTCDEQMHSHGPNHDRHGSSASVSVYILSKC